jgi:Periplasmic binding protein-like domain
VFSERGIRCPEDVSVVGFNDMPFLDKLRPPLTTVRVPHYEIGAEAGRMLLDAIEDRAATHDLCCSHRRWWSGSRPPLAVPDRPTTAHPEPEVPEVAPQVSDPGPYPVFTAAEMSRRRDAVATVLDAAGASHLTRDWLHRPGCESCSRSIRSATSGWTGVTM